MFGLAAAAIPVVLHLIARREPRKVVFPSVTFLTKRFESNRSRMRVRRWWLLALRIAALVALAVALAGPIIDRSVSITWLTIGLIAALGIALLVMGSMLISKSGSRATSMGLGIAGAIALIGSLIWGIATYASGPSIAIGNVQPAAVAILLDSSPTSAWKTPSDNRMERMKDAARTLVARLPPTSRVAIIDRSTAPATFSLDIGGAISKIEQLRSREVTSALASRIEAAIRLVRTSDLESRQVLVISDLAKSSWDQSLFDSGLAGIVSEEPSVGITLFDLGEFDGTNRALSLPEFVDRTPPRGTPIALSTTLSLNETTEDQSVSVTAEVELFQNDPSLPVVRDGQVVRPKTRSVDRTSVRIAPGGSSELVMTIPALSTGTHHGRVRLVGDDSLSLDDARYFTLNVLPPSRVLLVCEDQDETRVIAGAVMASAGLVDLKDAEFQVEPISYEDLAVIRLGDYDVLILVDPAQETVSDDSLIEYVTDGGSILMCLGPSIESDAKLGESALLPTLTRRWRAPEPGTFVEVIGNHPVTQPVASDTPWADFRVAQYWQTKPSDNDRTLARFAGTNHPALLQRSVKTAEGTEERSGRLLIVTTPLPALAKSTRSWNDLFGTDPWPAWLLLRQSVEYLAGRSEHDSITTVGTPIQLAVSSSDAEATKKRVQLFPPGESASPVPLVLNPETDSVAITDVAESGTYWLRGAGTGVGFSANLAPDAIDTTRIEQDQLDQIFGPDQYSIATNGEEIELSDGQAKPHVSLHSPAMLFALVVFLLELILGNRFYRR